MTQNKNKRQLYKALDNLNELKRIIFRDIQHNEVRTDSLKKAIVDVYYTLAQLERLYNIDLTIVSEESNEKSI